MCSCWKPKRLSRKENLYGILERSSLDDCWELGIKRGLNPAGVHELARMTYSRLSAPLSPAQSSLPNISFKTANAAVGTRHFDAHRDNGKRSWNWKRRFTRSRWMRCRNGIQQHIRQRST
jgi:hypothetical protein